jgi:hypothetical protein
LGLHFKPEKIDELNDRSLGIGVPNGLLQIFDTSTTNLGHTQTESGVNVSMGKRLGQNARKGFDRPLSFQIIL